MRHLLSLALATGLALATACGDSTKEPATPANPPPTEPTETPPVASSPPAAASSTPPAETPVAATPAEDAGAPVAPASNPNTGIIGETKDECTPVGVDFEKRARPKLKECYAEGKKKDPNLMGTVKIKVTVDVKGKIKSTKVIEKTLPDPVADCMLKAVKGTPFPEVDKCWDSTITIPITFPTPH
ncbi:MAG: AgmX/PglI C-terminal domain-containing protein [Labilithrix sp.]|nr:AgmX/PglI C-terminal domain-containing protein [Labilithrix sp.]MCW5811348.1 AgmX/PglI C-terminal domain-containing protein [Labilithrix sp.]